MFKKLSSIYRFLHRIVDIRVAMILSKKSNVLFFLLFFTIIFAGGIKFVTWQVEQNLQKKDQSSSRPIDWSFLNNTNYQPPAVRRTEVTISPLNDYYYNAGYISMTKMQEPRVKVTATNPPDDLTFELYDLSIDDVFNSLVYKVEKKDGYNEYNFVGLKDVTNLKLIKSVKFNEIKTNPDDKSNYKNKLVGFEYLDLPQNTTDVYYVRAVDGQKTYAGTIVFRSNLTALAKNLNTEILFWGKNLQTEETLNGASIEIYNLNSKKTLIARDTFDNEGIAKTQLTSEQDIALIKYQNQYTIVPLNITTKSDYYKRFDQKEANQQAYVFIDRPIYKPGDFLNFKAIIRLDDDAKLTPFTRQVRVTASGNKNNEEYIYFDKILTPSASGTVSGTVQIPDDIDVGYYGNEIQIREVRQDGNDYISDGSKYFMVENYRKPEYDVAVSFAKDEYINGQELIFTVDGKYFSGQPVSGGVVSYEIIRYKKYRDQFLLNNKDQNNYYYGYGSGSTLAKGELTLGKDGKAVFNKIVNFNNPANSSTDNFDSYLSVVVTFDDGSGNPAYATDNAVGYRSIYTVYRSSEDDQIYKTDYGYAYDTAKYFIGQKYNKKFEILDVLRDTPVKNINIEATLMHLTYTYNDIYGTEPQKTIIAKNNYISDQNGEFFVELAFAQKGSYELNIKYLDGDDYIGMDSFDFYPYTEQMTGFSNPDGSLEQITVTLDKETYEIGDIAKVRVTSPIKNLKALLTLERDRVHDYFPLNLNDGVSVVEIPVIESFNPNIYVNADSFNDQKLISNQQELKINPDTKKLNIKIINDKSKYLPGSDAIFEVFTTDKNGRPVSAELALWLVDKAIYELIPGYLPDPIETFWSKRYNYTTTAHSLESIYGNLAERGGGGGGLGDPRNIFKDTAFWRANVKTDTNGYAKLTVALPDNLTTWVISSVGFTTDNKFGLGKSELLVTKDVVVRPLLPNFIRLNDQMIVSVVVQNFTGEDLSFDVFASYTSGDLKPLFEHSDAKILNGQSKTFNWDLFANKADDFAKITFGAQIKDQPAKTDVLEVDLPAKRYGFKTSDTKVLFDSGVINFDLNSDVFNDQTKLNLYLDANPIASLIPASKYLIEYPYGCVEQTTSRLMPAIIASSNKTLFADVITNKDLDAMTKVGFDRLSELQNTDGGWSWYGNGKSDMYISAYVFNYLIQAKKAGLAIYPQTYDRAKQFFITKLNSAQKLESDIAIYALSLDDYFKPNWKLITDLKDYETDLLSLFVISNILNGQTDPALNGLDELVLRAAKIGNQQVYWGGQAANVRFATDESVTAMALQALIKADPNNELVLKGINYLSAKRNKTYWANSFGTAQTMRAILDFANSTDYLNADFTYQIKLNQKNLGGGAIKGNRNIIAPIEINLADVKNGVNLLEVQKQGVGNLNTILVMDLFNTNYNNAKTDNGFEIKRAYIGPSGISKTIAVGDVVDIYISAKNPQITQYTLLADMLPSGFIPVNTNLVSESASRSNNYGYYWNINNLLLLKDGANYYYDPDNYWGWYPDHRVNDIKDAGEIFFHYKARAISAGKYQIPPAYGELMYAPEVNGLSESQIITVTNEPIDLVDKKILPGADDLGAYLVNKAVKSDDFGQFWVYSDDRSGANMTGLPVTGVKPPEQSSDAQGLVFGRFTQREIAIAILIFSFAVVIASAVKRLKSKKSDGSLADKDV